jgi:hypothetical protein
MDETAPIDSAALFGSSFWVDDVKTGGLPFLWDQLGPGRGGQNRWPRTPSPGFFAGCQSGYSCKFGFKTEKTIMAFNFEMELQVSGFVQAVLTGVTLAIIGKLTNIPFS